MKSTIAIIGIQSFSGGSFAKFLLERDFSVVGFARSTKVDRTLLPYAKWLEQNPSRINIIPANILNDTEVISNRIQESGAEIVVNFAAQSMVAESWISPEDWYDVNVSALAKLVQNLVNNKNCNLKKFIQFTTPEVYGSTEGLIKENWNLNPTTPYAISRAASDFHLRALASTFDFPVIFTRAANVYGPHQKLYRVIPKLIVKAIKEETFELHGGGTSLRSFIHAEDVSNALMKITDQGIIGETYHISTEEFVSIADLVGLILTKLGKDFSKCVKIVDDRPGKDSAYLLDSAKIRSELRWKDEISLSEGIDTVVDWINQQWSILKDLEPHYVHIR